MTIKNFLYSTREELFQKAANQCASQITRGIEKQGRASIAVPGGSTPAPVFELLSRMSLDWHNVLIAPTDERWVDINEPTSNQKLLQDTLLVNQAKDARLMAMKNSAATATLGQKESEQSINELERPFDIVMIGMGNDGHFASLFPGSSPFEQAMDLDNSKSCIAIDATGCPVAGDNTERMSLTLSAILDAKLVMVLITGNDKLEVLRLAEKENNPSDKPIAALLNQNETPVEVYWAE
ncbi:MAG: 6-phosphogluconolactonase [Kangiellaceae bacterium]|nr:6-phosphogluconolactonase [Kangiellaceae bacterium]MCW8998605.1 6-phosphogluconolactonase [Kangiellaceae bacterium]